MNDTERSFAIVQEYQIEIDELYARFSNLLQAGASAEELLTLLAEISNLRRLQVQAEVSMYTTIPITSSCNHQE